MQTAQVLQPSAQRKSPLLHKPQSLHKSNLKVASEQLKKYFGGDSQALSSIPLSPQGTPFQQKVWKEMKKIKPGQTLSYGALAKKIGNPKAARAIGSACNKNPILLAIPCHRVIGADGSLTGFAAGMKRKRVSFRPRSWDLSIKLLIRIIIKPKT